jgi:hypothetical protein
MLCALPVFIWTGSKNYSVIHNSFNADVLLQTN